MKTFEEIANANKDGEFYAIGNNGIKYNASYSSKYGCMFFAIPSSVEIIGYIEK